MFPNVRSGYCRGYCQATQARSPAIARSELYLGTFAPAGSRIGQLTAARRIAATERSTSSVVFDHLDIKNTKRLRAPRRGFILERQNYIFDLGKVTLLDVRSTDAPRES